MKTTDTGIFLQRKSYSDSSLIVTFFTRKNGMQRFVFKGGKKKAHNLFPMSISELNYYGRQEAELLNLTAAEPENTLNFQFNPIKSTIAFFMAETLQKCVHYGDPDEPLFTFSLNAVQELEESDDLAAFPLWFIIELSELLGIKPLDELPTDTVLNLDTGNFQGRVSSLHRTYEGEAVDLIRSMIQNDPVSAQKGTKKRVREEALEIMLEYFSIHVPRFDKLASYEVVKEVLE